MASIDDFVPRACSPLRTQTKVFQILKTVARASVERRAPRHATGRCSFHVYVSVAGVLRMDIAGTCCLVVRNRKVLKEPLSMYIQKPRERLGG
jgi:hypothetical protein